jgi:hypothetical protein
MGAISRSLIPDKRAASWISRSKFLHETLAELMELTKIPPGSSTESRFFLSRKITFFSARKRRGVRDHDSKALPSTLEPGDLLKKIACNPATLLARNPVELCVFFCPSEGGLREVQRRDVKGSTQTGGDTEAPGVRKSVEYFFSAASSTQGEPIPKGPMIQEEAWVPRSKKPDPEPEIAFPHLKLFIRNCSPKKFWELGHSLTRTAKNDRSSISKGLVKALGLLGELLDPGQIRSVGSSCFPLCDPQKGAIPVDGPVFEGTLLSFAWPVPKAECSSVERLFEEILGGSSVVGLFELRLHEFPRRASSSQELKSAGSGDSKRKPPGTSSTAAWSAVLDGANPLKRYREP